MSFHRIDQPVGRFELLGQLSQLRRELEYVTKQRDWLSMKLEAAADREVRLISMFDEGIPHSGDAGRLPVE